jgi:hypothetical protein
LLLVFLGVAWARGAEPKIPILHSTDLFHPHADPTTITTWPASSP